MRGAGCAELQKEASRRELGELGAHAARLWQDCATDPPAMTAVRFSGRSHASSNRGIGPPSPVRRAADGRRRGSTYRGNGVPAMIELLRKERKARVFFGAHAQSSRAVAYVRAAPGGLRAIPLAVGDQLYTSPSSRPRCSWSAGGAAADRFPRRACLVLADALRAGAFVALALVGSFEATIVLALLAGVGNALFNPTVMAALPGSSSASASRPPPRSTAPSARPDTRPAPRWPRWPSSG